MKEYSLSVHIKPITHLIFSQEDDLIFASSKDNYISVWYTNNGELLGTYKCNSAVNKISINNECTKLLGACSGMILFVFDIKTGKRIKTIEHKTPILDVSYSNDCKHYFTITGKQFGEVPSINIFNSLNNNCEMIIKNDIVMTCCTWGLNNRILYVGTLNGLVIQYDVKTGKKLNYVKYHINKVSDIKISKKWGMLISSSIDKTCILYNMFTLKKLKKYCYGDDINSVDISPNKKYVITGEGRPEITTTTGAKKTFYDINFHHLIFEKKIGSLKSHFSPINCVSFSHDGKMCASGGEDSFIKLFKFDENYMKMKDDVSSIINKL